MGKTTGNKNTGVIILGVVLLVIGVGLFMQQGNMLPASITSAAGFIFQLWPAVVIIVGLLLIVGKSKRKRDFVGGVILLVMGIAMLGATMGWWGWTLVGPAAMVSVGLGLVLGAMRS